MSKIIILKKIIYETDQIYIEQDFGIEARLHDLIIVGRNDNDKMVTLESISEKKDKELPKSLKFSPVLHNF